MKKMKMEIESDKDKGHLNYVIFNIFDCAPYFIFSCKVTSFLLVKNAKLVCEMEMYQVLLPLHVFPSPAYPALQVHW